MTVPIGSPFIRLAVWFEDRDRRGATFPDLLMTRLMSLQLINDSVGNDELEITFDNRDMKLSDVQLIWMENAFTLVFGYGHELGSDEMSAPRIFKTKKLWLKGDTIVVTALANYKLSDEVIPYFQYLRTAVSERVAQNFGKNIIVASDASLTDPELMEEIVEYIGGRNGFRRKDILFTGTLVHGMFQPGGYEIEAGQAVKESAGGMSWRQILDDLASRIPGKCIIGNGLIEMRADNFVESAVFEFLWGDVVGSFPAEQQRNIISDSMDLEVDLMHAPKKVIARGRDVLAKTNIEVEVGDAETPREMIQPDKSVPLNGSNREMHLPTGGQTVAQAEHDARLAFQQAEHDGLKLKFDALGVPEVVAGRWCRVVFPSERFTGYYKLEKIAHRIDGSGPYISSLELVRRGLPVLPANILEELETEQAIQPEPVSTTSYKLILDKPKSEEVIPAGGSVIGGRFFPN